MKQAPAKSAFDAPAAEEAVLVMASHQKAVQRAARQALRSERSGAAEAEKVHALRVAIRRADAASAAFAGLGSSKAFKRLRSEMRKVRKAAGHVRDADVRRDLLERVARNRVPANVRDAARTLAAQTEQERAEASAELIKALGPGARKSLSRAFERVLMSLKDRLEQGESPELRDHAAVVFAEKIASVSEAADRDLGEIKRLHELRVAFKALRYGVEVFEKRFSERFRAAAGARLAELQDMLGEINDADVLVQALSEQSRTLRGRGTRDLQAALRRLIAAERTRRDRAHGAFLKRWEKFRPGEIVEALRSELSPPAPPPAHQNAIVETKPAPRLHAPGRNGKAPPGAAGARARRIAAIDVGTNSIRLIVSEVTPDGGYRVLDDEKEVTRLGRGLHETGRLDPDAIEHSAAAIANMKAIASGYGAQELRVVATAAAREAKNADRFIAAVRERAGVDLQVISGETEAMLAFRSASRAFDLASQPSMVLDIGGGSMEIILAAPRAGNAVGGPRSVHQGVVERIFSLPLGAVRLTEMFGGAERVAGKKLKALREHVAQALRDAVGRPQITPAQAIGTGGTITTLAAILRHHEFGDSADGLFGGVQGAEIARADLKHIIERLRSTPVKERAKIPGLPADRADIILAGLVAVDEALRYFGVNRLRAHEGGIRDGLLLSMVGATQNAGDAPRDPMLAVRRFASACAYEASHAEHVTTLALRLFDQVAAAEVVRRHVQLQPRHRMLLEAASVLHDVGYLISYAKHHKHSYHLIVHADLPGFERREVQVIANVARYHRSAEPKASHPAFAELEPKDQYLVRFLAAVLRVADGLDRTHSQAVRDLRVKWSPRVLQLEAVADHEPGVDLWGAERKAGLLGEVLNKEVRLEWQGKSERSGESENRKVFSGHTPEVVGSLGRPCAGSDENCLE